MPSNTSLDSCGRHRSPATLPGFHHGRLPRNKGLRYPADPPTVEEIIAVMRTAGDDADAVHLRGLIVVLWRAGLRISEALGLTESDLDPARAQSWSAMARAANAARSVWTVGGGSSSSRGCNCAPNFRLERCSACYAVRRAAGLGCDVQLGPDACVHRRRGDLGGGVGHLHLGVGAVGDGPAEVIVVQRLDHQHAGTRRVDHLVAHWL